MRAFMIVMTGPDGEGIVRWFPSPYCATSAIAWAKYLKVGWTADLTHAIAAEEWVHEQRAKPPKKKNR